MLTPELVRREEDGAALSTLAWRFPTPRRCASTAAVGGGLTLSSWVVNAQVSRGYRRGDLDVHGAEIADRLTLSGSGVVMLTAVDVSGRQVAESDGAQVTATVGVSDPVWAADPGVDIAAVHAGAAATFGTVNVVVLLPEAIEPAGLLNLIATVTEAKCQAFADFAIPGTGTPSDAVTIACPDEGDAHRFGGPRSLWGSRAACATYDAISAGLRAARDRSAPPC